MEITYFGLNAVRLRGREAAVMIDPYEPKLGLSPVRLNVQIVIFTHDDPTHFSLQGLSGEPHVVTGAGEFEIKGVAMTGTQTYHDAKKGAERGKNFAYTVEVDDVRICHLGHLGRGGTHINSAQATEIVNQIEPKLVIPISYKLPGLTLLAQNLEGLDKFAKEMGATDLTPQPKLQISTSPSVEETKLVILEPRGATANAAVD